MNSDFEAPISKEVLLDSIPVAVSMINEIRHHVSAKTTALRCAPYHPDLFTTIFRVGYATEDETK